MTGHAVVKGSRPKAAQAHDGQGPVRMCVICRGRFPKAELARYAQGRDGLEPDPGRTAPGRGVYVCARPECLERFRSMAQGKKLKGEIKK